MEASSSSSSSEPFLQSSADQNSESHIYGKNQKHSMPMTTTTTTTKKKKKKKRVSLKESSATSRSPSQTGRRVVHKRVCPRVSFGPSRRIHVADAISFRLGMSFAAFVSQILESKEARVDKMSADHLSLICATAVRESLANDFGYTLDSFVSNFEKSFRSTFRTLKLINESSLNNENRCESQLNVEGCNSGGAYVNSRPEEPFYTNPSEEGRSDHSEIMEGNEVTNSNNLELELHGQINQVIRFDPNPFGQTINRSALTSVERSAIEQTRSNDLKVVELSLKMEELKMKKTQLALNFESNNLDRSKLAMGVSKASFRAEKFKTELEDVRNAELLMKCVDCLVAGLVIMTSSLSYGAYVYSYDRITEATASCMPPTKGSNSWWFSNPVAKVNSGVQVLSCQLLVWARMVFGLFMIVSITYLLLQRSGSSKQTLPITFIVLLLAVLCGIAGKFCVDTLGGSGYHWVLFWETICAVHFFCNVFTSTLFVILYGPLNTQGPKIDRPRLAYWVRRLIFYGVTLIVLPMLCGLVPFASVVEWKDHFMFRVSDYIFITEED